MKKIVKYMLIVIGVVGVIIFLIGFWGRNVFILEDMITKLVETANRTEGVEVLDQCSDYGKLVGNGNGVEYYGAILIRTSSEEKVINLVEELEDAYEIVGYSEQTDREIDSVFWKGDFEKVSDDVFDECAGSLYRVYFFTTHEDSNLFDPKGH